MTAAERDGLPYEIYTYDANGMRVKKIKAGGPTTIYLHFGNNTIYESGPDEKVLIWAGARLVAELKLEQQRRLQPSRSSRQHRGQDRRGRRSSGLDRTTPYGTFYNLLQEYAVRDDSFDDASMVAGTSTAGIETTQEPSLP